MGKIFWGGLFLFVIFSIGSGPLSVDITRVCLVGMVLFVIMFNKNKVSRIFFVIVEIALLSTIIFVGIITKNIHITMLGLTISLLITIVFASVYLERRSRKKRLFNS